MRNGGASGTIRSLREDPGPVLLFQEALAVAKFEPGMYEIVRTFSPDGRNRSQGRENSEQRARTAQIPFLTTKRGTAGDCTPPVCAIAGPDTGKRWRFFVLIRAWRCLELSLGGKLSAHAAQAWEGPQGRALSPWVETRIVSCEAMKPKPL
jgi:hypothetical protein